MAIALSSLPSHHIWDHILSEGVNSISIKPLGGMQHLITFESLEEKVAMIECNWLDRWFRDMRDIDAQCAPLWRKTQIKVYRVPIRGWSYDNFFNIGCIFGRVLSVDYSDFNYAKVLIISDCLFAINYKLAVEISGKIHKICVTEDYNFISDECYSSHMHPKRLLPQKSRQRIC